MRLFGDGRAVLVDDPVMAERLGWGLRRRSLPDPEIQLRPRVGDPRREPWVTSPRWHRARGPDALWERGRGEQTWTYLSEAAGVERYLRRLVEPRRESGVRVAAAGLGRVGGTAIAALAALPSRTSGIDELLVFDEDPKALERWLLELGSIAAWRGRAVLPRVRAATPAEMFAECDVFLFCACAGVPPLETREDVRLVQFAPNREILRSFVAQAMASQFAGLFLIVSDPPEYLAQAAFRDANSDVAGRFTGCGLAPERIGGLALGVMWGRALAAARRAGWEDAVRRRGAAFGPHSREVLVFDDLLRPDPERCRRLTEAAREGNYRLRNLGFLPYVGPALSSVALSLPPLLAGGEVLASVFLDGTYFGAPARCPFGLEPSSHRMAPQVREALRLLYASLEERGRELGLSFSEASAPSTSVVS